MTGNFTQLSQQGAQLQCWECGSLGHTRRNCHMRSQDVSNQRQNVRCSSVRLTTLCPKSTRISKIEDRDQVSAGESTAALQQSDQVAVSGSVLRLLLRQNSRQRAAEVISESDATKALWRQWDSLVLKDCVLFRQGKWRRRPVLQLVVPAREQSSSKSVTETRVVDIVLSAQCLTEFGREVSGWVGAKMSPNSTWLDSTRLNTFDVSIPCILAVSTSSNSTARLARHDKLDWLDTTRATRNLVVV